MSEQKTNRSLPRLSASAMRVVLVVLLVTILLAMAGGFYAMYRYLSSMADTVATVQANAQTSDSKLQKLIETGQLLEKNKVVAERAEQIVAESRNYQYQNQIIDDLTSYATQADIKISSFTFQESSTTAAPSAGANQAKPAAPATPATQPGTGAPGGTLKTTNVSVQIGSGLSYTKLLHFLHLIEQNLTRMQIANLSLSKGEGPDGISPQTLSLEVYVR